MEKLSVVIVIVLVFAVAVSIANMGDEQTAPQKPTVAEKRELLCLVPYSWEYCAAHQEQMYREQARREG